LLFVAQRPYIHLFPEEHGKFFEETIIIEVGEKSGVLEHKRGNISETRRDRGKVTMEGLGPI